MPTTKTTKIIKRIEQIPTLPVIAQKVLNLVNDDQASFAEITSLIERDQALAAKILKIANSSFYGFLNKISSLEHALVVLGLKEVRSILLGFTVHNFFKEPQGIHFDHLRFWKHAIICSQVTKLIRRHFNLPPNDTLFLAGLTHDIGKVVIEQYLQDDFLEILAHLEEHNTTFSKAEKEVLGTTHYQIAAKLFRQWKFPNEVVLPILYHHAPWHDKQYEINSQTLYLANILTKLCGYSCHPKESRTDALLFANSPECNFMVKSGFDLDYEVIMNLTRQIQEILLLEEEKLMELFG